MRQLIAYPHDICDEGFMGPVHLQTRNYDSPASREVKENSFKESKNKWVCICTVLL